MFQFGAGKNISSTGILHYYFYYYSSSSCRPSWHQRSHKLSVLSFHTNSLTERLNGFGDKVCLLWQEDCGESVYRQHEAEQSLQLPMYLT